MFFSCYFIYYIALFLTAFFQRFKQELSCNILLQLIQIPISLFLNINVQNVSKTLSDYKNKLEASKLRPPSDPRSSLECNRTTSVATNHVSGDLFSFRSCDSSEYYQHLGSWFHSIKYEYENKCNWETMKLFTKQN